MLLRFPAIPLLEVRYFRRLVYRLPGPRIGYRKRREAQTQAAGNEIPPSLPKGMHEGVESGGKKCRCSLRDDRLTSDPGGDQLQSRITRQSRLLSEKQADANIVLPGKHVFYVPGRKMCPACVSSRMTD